MPSKMVLSRPGPSSTLSGLPVRTMPSPTVSPLVSSYTCPMSRGAFRVIYRAGGRFSALSTVPC